MDYRKHITCATHNSDGSITATELLPEKIVVTHLDKSIVDMQRMGSNIVDIVLMYVLIIVTLLILSYILKHAWNETLPHIFSIRKITFVEAAIIGIIANVLIKDNYITIYNHFKKNYKPIYY